MTGCERLSDRMVEVANGSRAWTDEEQQHLRACSHCAAEWRLVGAASRFGTTPLDAERIAGRVIDRLAREGRGTFSAIPRGVRWVVGLAAAAVIAIAVVRNGSDSAGTPGAVPRATPTILSELDGLTTAELELVLDVVEPAASEASLAPDSVRLGDLTPSELERILRSLEG